MKIFTDITTSNIVKVPLKGPYFSEGKEYTSIFVDVSSVFVSMGVLRFKSYTKIGLKYVPLMYKGHAEGTMLPKYFRLDVLEVTPNFENKLKQFAPEYYV